MNTFKELVNTLGSFLSSSIIPILFGIGVLSFMWNITHFIASSDNEAERVKFKKYSVNSILALFILMAVWGIVAIATRTIFGVSPFVPQLPVKCEQDPGCLQ